MKRIIALLLCVTLLISLTAIDTMAASATVASPEAESMQRLMDLGIFSSTAPDKMELSRAMTREELAAALVRINGKEDKITLFKGTVLFSDVPASHWSNGYVNTASKLGLMTAMADGKFHPNEKVTFAQVAKSIGKMLKYEEFYLTGSYPENYLSLLNHLSILEGISYSATSSVTRGQMALVLDRALDTKVFGGVQKLIDTVSIFQNIIILENQVVNPKSDARKILTEKGVYTLSSAFTMPDAGKKYIARMKDGQITHLAKAHMSFQELSVKTAVSGTLTLNDGTRTTLPTYPVYYYKGQPVSYQFLIGAIKCNSSLVLASDKDGIQYGVLFDPMTSDPKVITASMAGFPMEVQYNGKLIDRDGKYITPSQIEVNDVLYEVTDIWKNNGYVIVHSNTVSGKITAILPNKISPDYLEVDGKAYELSDHFPVEKLNGSGSTQVGETCKVLIDSDGKAIDVLSEGNSDNEEYVLVLNAYSLNSGKTEDFGTKYEYVNLLKSDGSKKTYRVGSSMNQYRGKIMKYKVIATGKEYDTVELTSIEYPTYGSLRVNRDDRMLGDYCVANDAVIFNLVNTSLPGDVQASVIRWSDLPNGYLMEKKVQYLHTSGDFNDIDVLLLEDAMEESIRYGLAVSKTSMFDPMSYASYEVVTLLIDGKEYQYRGQDLGIFLNSPVRVRMAGGQIVGVEYALTAKASDTVIGAVDSTRIRLGGTVYQYHKDITIYKLIDNNSWKKIEPTELKKGEQYRQVTVYLDKPLSYGGKAVMITLR